jgi:hypothetical protein
MWKLSNISLVKLPTVYTHRHWGRWLAFRAIGGHSVLSSAAEALKIITISGILPRNVNDTIAKHFSFSNIY